jgi:preprotein translocase SecE subunit
MRLLRASVIGAIYLAVCLALVAVGIPYVWKQAITPWLSKSLGSFVDLAGLACAIIAAIIGLIIAGIALAGSHPPEGLRAGVFTILAGVFAIFMVTVGIGQLLENYVIKDRTSKVGLALTIAVGVLLLAGGVYYALKKEFRRFVLTFENQGWFRMSSYKGNQGQRVRRLTMLGILAIVGSGVYAMLEHQSITGNWTVRLPYSGMAPVTLLPDARFTVPLLCIALGLWGAWRAVNFPIFADFLIATEAEMNKVSWSNRKRLVQDTIVVLVTVVMFAVFLLVVDQLWGWMLTRESLGGIVPKPAIKAKQENKEAPW